MKGLEREDSRREAEIVDLIQTAELNEMEDEEYLDASYKDEDYEEDSGLDDYSQVDESEPALVSADDEIETSWSWFLNLPTNWKVFFLYLLPLVICTASWNTHCNQLVRKLTNKEKELMDLRHRMLYTTAELVGLERINSVEERIKVLKLPLEHSNHPPYIIYVDSLPD